MAGHLYSALLQKNLKLQAPNYKQYQNSKSKAQKNLEFVICDLKFPALALLVSGGHTELVLTKGHGKYKVVGETLDDAAGEAFDKVARLLGLPYPGGQEIAKISAIYEARPHKIKLPRPMIGSRDYNFSFSGLKTAVLYLIRDLGEKKAKRLRPAIAREFQNAVVEVLVKKTIRAAKQYKVKTILLGGGVAANKLLREQLAKAIRKDLPDVNYQLPMSNLTGDNALMIALAAYFQGKKKDLDQVEADANLHL
jgi:N6-L-threonylcarbamoyladenine synthase